MLFQFVLCLVFACVLAYSCDAFCCLSILCLLLVSLFMFCLLCSLIDCYFVLRVLPVSLTACVLCLLFNFVVC